MRVRAAILIGANISDILRFWCRFDCKLQPNFRGSNAAEPKAAERRDIDPVCPSAVFCPGTVAILTLSGKFGCKLLDPAQWDGIAARPRLQKGFGRNRFGKVNTAVAMLGPGDFAKGRASGPVQQDLNPMRHQPRRCKLRSAQGKIDQVAIRRKADGCDLDREVCAEPRMLPAANGWLRKVAMIFELHGAGLPSIHDREF